MENSEKTISVELSSQQYAFLTEWQKTHEQELGIEVPIGALVRKAVDAAMKSARQKDERPSFANPPSPRLRTTGASGGRPPRSDKPIGRFGDKPAGRFGDKPAGGRTGDRPTGRFGDKPDFKSGPRKPFGARPSTGRGGPKFNMLGAKNKTRTFNK